jgi:DNA-binding LacI/PurR family transcriptional regulator
VRDVANAAGVAVGSVSRALNEHPGVSPVIRERILSAARLLGYTRLRRRPARATAPGPMRPGGVTLGLICFGMEDALVQLPVMSSAMHGIESAVAAERGMLMFSNIPRGDTVPAFLAENRVAGVVVKGPNLGELPSPAENALLRHIYQLPHVWLMGKPSNAEGDHCNFDNEIAGRLVAEHLRAKGHTHVAFLNPKPGHTQFEPLKRAFCAAATESRVDVFEPERPLALGWPLPAVSSQEIVDMLVARWSALPARKRATAFAVGADTTAVQLYASFARLGIRVGRDVGLVSCNNEQSLVMGLTPALTTIDVRADAIGRTAVARLLWRASHPREEASVRILIEPVLVERESVPQLRG